MSESQDGCPPSNSNSDHLNDNPKPATGGHDAEPADPAPDTCDPSARRELPLAPGTLKVSRLPDPLVESGDPITVGEAGETYLKVQRSNWNDDGFTSKHERHKYKTYPHIHETDRHFQTEYDGLTTVMLTRRLSPLDDTQNWLTPWECNEMLHGGNVQRSVRRAVSYQLGSFEFEWLAVTAPTRSAGTPHEHIYVWIEDPGDEVATTHFEPALNKHLKYCSNAYEEHHRYRTDGSNGAITVDHDPGAWQDPPDKFFDIMEKSETCAKTGSYHPPTGGAQYLASQLAHLQLADYYAEDREDPSLALFEGAALAWASPRDWFRSSQGIPSLNNAAR